MWQIYRIYYNNEIVYVGRTNNIENRIRQHMLSGKLIDIFKVSKIEFADVDTEADMNLYELYYILQCKPRLNAKDMARDELTINLPELAFRQFYTHLWDTWEQKIKIKQQKKREKAERLSIAREILKEEHSTMGKEILQQQISMSDS